MMSETKSAYDRGLSVSSRQKNLKPGVPFKEYREHLLESFQQFPL